GGGGVGAGAVVGVVVGGATVVALVEPGATAVVVVRAVSVVAPSPEKSPNAAPAATSSATTTNANASLRPIGVQSRGRARRLGYIPPIASEPAPFPSIADDLALALELAHVADEVTLSRFRAHDLTVETKPDLTPVTDADHAAEEALRAVLRERRPHDGVLGEEAGELQGEARAVAAPARRWVIDPIDGTKGYARGIPVWATLVALEHDGVPVVGVVSAPALGARWWAGRGLGAFRDGEPIGVSAVADLADAHLSYDSLGDFDD